MNNIEENELLGLFESNKLPKAENESFEIQLAQQIAAQHSKKNARINIRLSELDLERIKRIAAVEGLPYQTLISSILHKYAAHSLKLN
jgi:predicted DNA binding CopG/RHH family protein